MPKVKSFALAILALVVAVHAGFGQRYVEPAFEIGAIPCSTQAYQSVRRSAFSAVARQHTRLRRAGNTSLGQAERIDVIDAIKR